MSAVGLWQFAKHIKIIHFSLSALLSLCWLPCKPGLDSVSQTKTEKGNEEQAFIALLVLLELYNTNEASLYSKTENTLGKYTCLTAHGSDIHSLQNPFLTRFA